MVAVAAVALYAFLQARRRDRLAAGYAAAMALLDRADYQCAVAGLAELTREEPAYPAARQKLAAARLGLAGQYAAAGQWSTGILELDAVLRGSIPPTPPRWPPYATSMTAPSPTRSAGAGGSRRCACVCNEMPASAARRSNRCQPPSNGR